MPKFSPVQLRFNESSEIDTAMCTRYDNTKSRAGTAKDDAIVGHAIAELSPALHQIILSMTKAGTPFDLENVIKLSGSMGTGSAKSQETVEDKKKPDTGGMGGLSA